MNAHAALMDAADLPPEDLPPHMLDGLPRANGATPWALLPPVGEHFIPETHEDLLRALASWEWRIFSGRLYLITTKGDDAPDDEPEIAVPFRPNAGQRLLLANLHNRNIILKARQMGFSTLIEIMALDQALFNADQEVVVIAHTKDAATKLYRKKVCFAYDRLPACVRENVPTVERSQTQMVFANGSSIEVTSSARGGTPHFLHVSEMGKIAAKFPDKATEITTGSLQGVPKSGLVFIESTAEGKSGAFYTMSQRAEKAKAEGKSLSQSDYRFHFFAWWMMPEYRLSLAEAKRTKISALEHAYFDRIEGEMDEAIDLEQRAWYISKRDNDFADKPDLMWREYPSSPEECWQASTEGKYLANQMARARKEGRIGRYPLLRHVPVNTFWDLGATDDTAVWLHQRVGAMDHFPAFIEASGEGYLHFVLKLEAMGCIWGTHYLPHDASAKHQGEEQVFSAVSQLRAMRPSWTFVVVPRVQTIQHGIDLLRDDMATHCYDEVGCKEGIEHIDNYSREYNIRLQVWADSPRHDEHSHAADALRQKAQGFVAGDPNAPARRARPRPSGMTA